MPGFELFGPLEHQEVNRVLETGVLMRYGFENMREGVWKAKELEQSISRRMGVKHTHVTSSGTSALTVALACLGVGFGDEVLIPTFTFVASFEAVLALGAVPILVDIDETLTLCPKAVEQAITPNTKVVMPVHMCGSMANLNALNRLCKDHNLYLLEDACQAIGGSYEGKPLGSLGDIGCFSFDYVKTITCGEGGALITNHDWVYQRAHAYSDHGHDHIGSDRGAEQHPFLGYNYRISELHAAVGCAQIQRLDEFLALQKQNFSILRQALSELPEVQFRKVPMGGEESYAFLNFYLPTEHLARRAQQKLTQQGLGGCFYWYDNNWHYYKKWSHLIQGRSLHPLHKDIKRVLLTNQKPFVQSDHWMGRNISVLIKIGWTEKEVHEIAKKIQEVLTEVLG